MTWPELIGVRDVAFRKRAVHGRRHNGKYNFNFEFNFKFFIAQRLPPAASRLPPVVQNMYSSRREELASVLAALRLITSVAGPLPYDVR